MKFLEMKPNPKTLHWIHRHPRTTLFYTLVVLTISVTFLFELGARILKPEWAPARAERANFWIYDDLLGWAHEPLQEGLFVHRDFSVKVKNNSFGLRDDEYSKSRNERKRMLILGDSFAWGFGVEKEERFDEILERNNEKWEIINASVSGYGTDQQLLYFEKFGKSFTPNVVLLLFFQEDFDNNVADEQYWYFKPYFKLTDGALTLENSPVPRSTVKQELDRFFYGKTYFLAIIYSNLIQNATRMREFWSCNILGSSSCNSLIEPIEKSYKYDLTIRLLTEISEQCRDIGAQFVIVSIPMREEKRSVLLEFSELRNDHYLPLDKHFSEYDGKVTFDHDVHWNASGHRVAADAIEGFLRTVGIF